MAVDARPGDTLSVMWMSAMPFEVPAGEPAVGLYLLVGDRRHYQPWATVIATNNNNNNIINNNIPIEPYRA